MSDGESNRAQRAPGDKHPETVGVGAAVQGYLLGLVLAIVLTAVSFYVARSTIIWRPGIPMGLVVLAIAQMGVHLVFFLHLNTGPDSLNTSLALAFGLLIVFLIIAGSLFIMSNLDHNMLPMAQIMQMQR